MGDTIFLVMTTKSKLEEKIRKTRVILLSLILNLSSGNMVILKKVANIPK